MQGAIAGAVAGGIVGEVVADDLKAEEKRVAETLGLVQGEDEILANYFWEELQALSKPQSLPMNIEAKLGDRYICFGIWFDFAQVRKNVFLLILIYGKYYKIKSTPIDILI